MKFSLGFGPKLVSKQLGETEYLISAFPLGGYVKMFGENPAEAPDENMPAADMHRSFAMRPVWQRFIILRVGALNILLADAKVEYGANACSNNAKRAQHCPYV